MNISYKKLLTLGIALMGIIPVYSMKDLAQPEEQRTHSYEGQGICLKCWQDFYNGCSCRRDISKEQESKLPKLSKNQIVCPTCGKTCKTSKGLRAHASQLKHASFDQSRLANGQRREAKGRIMSSESPIYKDSLLEVIEPEEGHLMNLGEAALQANITKNPAICDICAKGCGSAFGVKIHTLIEHKQQQETAVGVTDLNSMTPIIISEVSGQEPMLEAQDHDSVIFDVDKVGEFEFMSSVFPILEQE